MEWVLLNFISAKHAQLLQKNQLDTFENVWDFPIQWIDAPNKNRGGWSAVGRLEIQNNGKPNLFFVKKQLNHTTRTLRHPLNGVPTFAKEFAGIQLLKQRGLNVPEVAYFAEQNSAQGQQAILITESLDGYQPLDVFDRSTLSLRQQRQLISNVAKTIRQMHGAGVVHRALYAKHIFVKPNNIKSSGDAFEVALIDFEKFRPIYFAPLQAADDLMTLNYRTSGWTNTNRLYFLKQYLAQPSLNSWGKLFCKWVIYRSNQKIKQARLSKNGIQHG